MIKYAPFLAYLIFGTGIFSCHTPVENTDWRYYLGSPESSQFSPLSQITKENVASLKVAWTFHSEGADTINNRTQIQCNPLIINGIMYATSPRLHVFALDAATGKELWRFVPGVGGGLSVNRGLAWWEQGDERRLMVAVGDQLFALNPDSGEPIPSFGQNGSINLHDGLGEGNAIRFVIANTPGIIYKDTYIIGSRVDEDYGAAPGHIRAFDIRSGKLQWVFHTIPQPGEPGYETWENPEAWKTTGGANSWAGLALDEKAGVVFVPTGSASYDFWGGNRKGENLFANCLIALDANTGKRIWHFQTVHHDVWDKDLCAPPNLLTISRNGQKIEAVAQITKNGYVFLFDRKNGVPLFPVVERPVPQTDIPGEKTHPTQPHPTLPKPLVRHAFLETDINPYSPDKVLLRDSLRRLRTGNLWMPPSQQGTVIFPGFDGGAEWGGAATDPNGILYVNANEMPWVQKMRDMSKLPPGHPGQSAYFTYCAGCHGYEREGDPQGGYPSLVDLEKRQKEDTIAALLITGKNRMPSFKQLSDAEREAIVAFLFNKQVPDNQAFKALQKPVIPFKADGYNRFLDSKKMPAISPPWGTLSAIDMNTGEYRWQVPLGDWKIEGAPPTGTENYGGPVVTASGVLFIAATKDEMFRAFDAATGKVLWETKLPAGGYATPAVYSVGGKQYVVIACGGGKMGTRSGDAYVAFALP
jgi:quinoprotein glucose dehydrogenase